MNEYFFDNGHKRENTNCVKYDLRKTVFGNESLIPMWVADMDFATPPFVLEAIQERLKHPILGYSTRGKAYYEAIIFWLQARHQWTVESSQVSFSPGVVPGLVMAILAISKPADKIIIQSPVYHPFYSAIKDNNRQILENPLKNCNGNYEMDFEQLELLMQERPKAILISNPHNPVGRVWKKEELARLVEICYNNKVIILSDEIHSDLVYSPNQHIPLLSISQKAVEIGFCFMSPSKTFNLAGLSTSYVISQNAALLQKYNQMLENFHLGQGNIFGAIALEAAYSLEGENWLNQLLIYLTQNIEYVRNFIGQHFPQVQISPTEATYLQWINMESFQMSDEALFKFWIDEVGVGINEGRIFGTNGSGFIRLNIAAPFTIIKLSMDKLLAATKRLGY
jgi:cystathionine beta-lyase